MGSFHPVTCFPSLWRLISFPWFHWCWKPEYLSHLLTTIHALHLFQVQRVTHSSRVIKSWLIGCREGSCCKEIPLKRGYPQTKETLYIPSSLSNRQMFTMTIRTSGNHYVFLLSTPIFAHLSILYFSTPSIYCMASIHSKWWEKFQSFRFASSSAGFVISVIYRQTLHTTLAHIEGQWEVKWEQWNERKLERAAGRADKYHICSRAAVHQYENAERRSAATSVPLSWNLSVWQPHVGGSESQTICWPLSGGAMETLCGALKYECITECMLFNVTWWEGNAFIRTNWNFQFFFNVEIQTTTKPQLFKKNGNIVLTWSQWVADSKGGKHTQTVIQDFLILCQEHWWLCCTVLEIYGLLNTTCNKSHKQRGSKSERTATEM